MANINEDEMVTNKTLRQKSPNAPAYSLKECVEDTQKIFWEENQVPVSRESIAEHLGLAAHSGPFNRKLSSLRQYGLLEPVGKDLRVSGLFLRIDHSEDEVEQHRALRESLSRPTIFQGLLAQYDSSGLPSEMNLTNHLILKHKFTKKNAEVVAKAFLESVRFSGLFNSSGTSPVQSEEVSLQKSNQKVISTAEESPLETTPHSTESLRNCRQEIPLGIGRRVILDIPEDITHEELTKVIRVLKALSET